MNQENRYEIKFILNEQELTEAYKFIKSINAYIPYPSREINSLYFDTVDFQSIRDNLAGVSNRQKIRLRWYGNNENNKNSLMSLELKLRNGRVGSKRRYNVPQKLSNDIYKSTSREIGKCVFNNLKVTDEIINDLYLPTLFINYIREYYQCNNELRITIDKNINFRDIHLHSPLLKAQKIPYNEYIMELKFPLYLKNTVSSMIRTFNLVPKRHSKYITGMSKLGYAVYI